MSFVNSNIYYMHSVSCAACGGGVVGILYKPSLNINQGNVNLILIHSFILF